ncbi:MAG: TonB-dependent receptor plug domain-containing protein [Bacteroidota bacterium]
MIKRIIRFAAAAVLLTAQSAWGQTSSIQGSVVEAGDGSPIPNAVVLSAGSGSVLGSTDGQGKFSVRAAEGSALKFRAPGYSEATAPARDGMRVALRAEVTELDEIVVVGFGTQKKSNVTGSIAQVKAKDLENMSLFRVEQALQGRTAGVQITQNSGQPGAGSVVRIRGTASINGSDPLYVVDGVVIGGGIDYLNPNDIETIEVLKDAASAAIYGARGANGVIIVTTKSGKGAGGQMNVSVSAYQGIQNPWRKVSTLNATEYATLQNEMAGAAGQAIPYLNPRALGEGTDWQDAVFNRNAPVQSLDVSMSQSSKEGSYFASVGRYRQEGIVAPGRSNFERI